MHLVGFAFGGVGDVHHVGDGGDDVHVELAVEAFLDDFHVEHAEESAAEPEAEGGGRFRFEGEGGVVELEFLDGGAQVFVVFGFDGVDAGEDHGLDLLEAVDGGVAGGVPRG